MPLTARPGRKFMAANDRHIRDAVHKTPGVPVRSGDQDIVGTETLRVLW